MSIEVAVAIVAAAFTIITAIPVIRELFSWRPGRDKRLLSLANEALAGPCDEHERTYWTNARRLALSRFEARQAYPAGRLVGPILMTMGGIAMFGLEGDFWSPFSRPPTGKISSSRGVVEERAQLSS